MADLKSLPVPEILAYCRNVDGEGGSEPAADAPSEVPAAADPVPTESPQPAKSAAAPADRGSMSVADMLAAARGEKESGATKPVAPAAETPSAATSDKPAKKLDPGSMSVADMLAAARGEKVAASATAAPKPKSKAAAKPATAATKAKAPAKPAKTGPMDTSSILAAARGGTAKPGPITKAEAATKAKAGPTAKSKEKPKAPPMPAKPEYAKAVFPPPQKTETDRRTMMEVLFGSMLAVGWGAMVMAAGLSSLVTARFFFPNLLVEPPNRFKVGFPGDFSVGAVATKFKAQFGIWIVNSEYEGQQQIVALKSVCTHLGCTPNWLEAEQKFKCPCHGSGFYKEGINFEGPAPRPLERYAIKVADDGQIEVDKSKTYQEQLGQWGDGSSFVPV